MERKKNVEDLLAYNNSASGLHSKIISRLIARRKLSERAIRRRYESWRQVDDHCRLFIDLSKRAKNGDSSTDQNTKEMPWARSIVVPMSYAILQVEMTQLLGIFTRRTPAIEIDGIGPEDIRPAKMMNATLAYDQVQTNYLLELYSAIQDSRRYGMAAIHDGWEDELGWKVKRAKPSTAAILKLLGVKTSKRVWGKLREYNQVETADMYNFFPDPRVSASNVQKGEFCGHRIFRGYNWIWRNSIENGGIYFNTDAIQNIVMRQSSIRQQNRTTGVQMNLIGSTDEKDKGFHAIDSFVIEIIPKDWELGSEERPQKWQFTWVDDQVIIRAHPMEYDHQRFPYSIFESNIDTHVFSNPGSIENLDGLQRFMNWKYNSHVQNLIRFLNNRMVYSSMLIESIDVENPDAAMHIRLTAQGEQLLAQGKMSIDQMIHQLQLTDVTGPLMNSVNQDFDFAMRMTGASDQMMGQVTRDKRTLGEVQRVGHEGSARMARDAMLIDVQGIRPLALRWCANRQQFTSEEQYYRIAGKIAEEFGGDRILVRPEDLWGNFDYIPKTGPEPGDPAERAAALTDGLLAIMKSDTLLAMPDRDGKYLDPHEFIKEILRDKDVKNVNDFYREVQQAAQNGLAGLQGGMAPQVTVMPDEQLAQQQAAGNVIPMAA